MPPWCFTTTLITIISVAFWPPPLHNFIKALFRPVPLTEKSVWTLFYNSGLSGEYTGGGRHGSWQISDLAEKKPLYLAYICVVSVHSVWPSLKITAGCEDSFTDVRVPKWIFSNSTICINPEQCLLLIKVSREPSGTAEVKKFCFAPLEVL